MPTPMSIGESTLLIDGYFDWVFNSSEESDNFHFNPQVKLDMRSLLGGTQKWYLGFEYDYWKSKFGIRDSASRRSNQNTYSLLVKWHF